MPHIHTNPNQHDMTVSAWIIRRVNDEWLCMVHFHKKIEKYMQIGGHIELDETPWQSVAHEIIEESGYNLIQLNIAQHSLAQPDASLYIIHPSPFTMNTHNVDDGHYHSDLCYGFIADSLPLNKPSNGESSVVRWMNLEDMKKSSELEETLKDVYLIYKYFVETIDSYSFIPADSFSLEKPQIPSATYLRGKPTEKSSDN